MKKFAALAVVLAFICMAPAFALAKDNGPNPSQFCSAFGDFGFTHGECVSFLAQNQCDVPFISNGNTELVCACKAFKDSLPDVYEEFFGQSGLGHCIQLAKELLGD